MFGYTGGETPETVSRKRAHGVDALEHWSFLTPYDLRTSKNAAQLSTMVAIRSSISQDQATHDVAAWMDGREF